MANETMDMFLPQLYKYHNVDYLEILIRVREFEYFGPKKGDVN